MYGPLQYAVIFVTLTLTLTFEVFFLQWVKRAGNMPVMSFVFHFKSIWTGLYFLKGIIEKLEEEGEKKEIT